jgi:hypothetical protein
MSYLFCVLLCAASQAAEPPEGVRVARDSTVAEWIKLTNLKIDATK